MFLNAAQVAAVIAVTILKKTKIYLEWGRGAGKSFILAYFMREMVIQMPAASFALVGSTYQQILSRTLPSTKEGLAILGLFEDYDYVVGKNGKKMGFAAPLQAPDKWENVIHFSNGAIFQLVSLDNPNSGRGLNAFGVIGDEAALFDPEKLYTSVKTTNRSKKARFAKATLLGAEIYASSTPISKKGRWFTDMEETAKKKPESYAFIKANAMVNITNLRKEWFDEMREEAPSQVIYEAEILNIRPKEILNGFYPQLQAKKHYYSDFDNDYLQTLTENYSKAAFNCHQDNDITAEVPLVLSIDWGVFLSATVAQALPKEYRVLKSLWVKQPSDIDDLINDFCEYYAPLDHKVVRLYYGHDGNKRTQGRRETYGDEVARLLRAKGWQVFDRSKGKPAARHNDKYLLINSMLKESNSSLPRIRINENNNKDLMISLERSEAKEGAGGIEKVKKDERNKSVKQEHATHLSDAFDIPLFGLYAKLLKKRKDSWQPPLTM